MKIVVLIYIGNYYSLLSQLSNLREGWKGLSCSFSQKVFIRLFWNLVHIFLEPLKMDWHCDFSKNFPKNFPLVGKFFLISREKNHWSLFRMFSGSSKKIFSSKAYKKFPSCRKIFWKILEKSQCQSIFNGSRNMRTKFQKNRMKTFWEKLHESLDGKTGILKCLQPYLKNFVSDSTFVFI